MPGLLFLIFTTAKLFPSMPEASQASLAATGPRYREPDSDFSYAHPGKAAIASCKRQFHAGGMANHKLLRGRISRVGACYSVTMATHRREKRFTETRFARCVVNEMDLLALEARVDHLAWVVMPDHVHWLLRLRQGTLGSCIARFKSRTARAINLTGDTRGPLWQAGYYERQMRSEADLRQQARYVVENPLRRGLIEKIEDYPFWWCRWIANSADIVEV